MIRYVKIIFLKEIKEILRDKVTFIMLLLEILGIPLLMFSMNYIYKNDVEEIDVAVLENLYSSRNGFDEFINTVNDIDIIVTKVGEKEIGDKDVLVSFTEEGIEFIYNSNSYNSYEYGKKLCSYYQNYCLKKYLKNNNKEYNIKFVDENGREANESRNILNVFIPLVLIVIATQGTMELGAGLIAGERERGTLELLLLNIENKKEILLGKAIVLVLVNMFSTCIGLLTIFVSSYHFRQGIIQGYESYIMIFVLLVLVNIIFSLVALGISMAIKSYRSAQLIVGIIMSIPSALMGIIAYGMTLKWDVIMLKIPIVNLIEAVHKVCFGNLTLLNFIYCVAFNVLVAVIIGAFDIKLIKSELI